MPKVVYDAARGLVQETGAGIQFSEMPFSPVQAITTNESTISRPGVYTVSGTTALTTFLPNPNTIPGGSIVVRAISNKAHILTGSAGFGALNIFAGTVGGPVREGTRLTFPGVAEGESVALVSDGRVYLLAATSGSMAIAAPA
jgi:hypothetical protein